MHGFKNVIIVVVSRLIKLAANVTKLLSYVFHFVLPNKRFTLPERASPWLSPKGKAAIPRTLWQTNFTDQVTLPVYLNYLFNRLMAPRFEYRFMVTQARRQFIAENCEDEVLACYDRLQIGAAQADLWRLIVLHQKGGVYLDIDAHAIWPLASILGKRREELYVITRLKQFSNYFIASKPHNPNLAALIQQVCANIEANELTNVFDITGPGVFNQVLDIESVPGVSYRHACNQGSFTNEHFQYIDKPAGKWTKEQEKVAVIAPDHIAKNN
ncbi:mannosyltransferase OCH1-like enzyme [Vreelandella songnenensis]|uniref:Mannosyltransferase OCH1-like enzyme n=1 Tax=Vreelandella songnenensis TaxID=1176243 RepID=A0A2T0UU67_9GAMM|nr:glycosyltransferase [Halomonas songnenensis]PRY61387.1 mannosyltransferase OCH1-like enzyme [Halomonas songnenensis]